MLLRPVAAPPGLGSLVLLAAPTVPAAPLLVAARGTCGPHHLRLLRLLRRLMSAARLPRGPRGLRGRRLVWRVARGVARMLVLAGVHVAGQGSGEEVPPGQSVLHALEQNEKRHPSLNNKFTA